jgi:tetratricopeptide (TPR) repeat protein
MAAIEQAQGNYAEAVRLYGESMKLEEELGDKRGIAITLGQMGQLARAQGRLKEALGYFVKAFAIFEELHSPYRDLALKDIASIREQVGEEQFEAWVRESSGESGN